MQKDFHYYGTYVIARSAGIKKEHAQKIATAAQFVDESVKGDTYNFKNGSSVVTEVTAHHATSFENINKDDQRLVWVPFHFLPGNLGRKFTERLICVKDSEIAKLMVDNAINQHESIYSDFLIGITAHVYADTFAHYGFSGVSSTKNKIINDSIKVEVENPGIKKYIKEKAKNFLSKNQRSFILKNIRDFISTAAELASGALGHGAVATYPDRPYLKWSFDYEISRDEKLNFNNRDNKETFIEASEALFKMFKRYIEKNNTIKDPEINIEFSDVFSVFKDVLAKEGTCEERINEWNEVIKANLGFESEENEILPFLGEAWFAELNDFVPDNYISIDNSSIYQFYNAANYHRNYILKKLLPGKGIYVI